MTKYCTLPIFELTSSEGQQPIFHMHQFIPKNMTPIPQESSSVFLVVEAQIVEVLLSPKFREDSLSDTEIDLLGKEFWDFILNEIARHNFEELNDESRTLCPSINHPAG